MPDAKRRSMRRLQGESQMPACVPWWFANYSPEQQNQYLVDVDDSDSQVGAGDNAVCHAGTGLCAMRGQGCVPCGDRAVCHEGTGLYAMRGQGCVP